jgi:hypothetical protein
MPRRRKSQPEPELSGPEEFPAGDDEEPLAADDELEGLGEISDLEEVEAEDIELPLEDDLAPGVVEGEEETLIEEEPYTEEDEEEEEDLLADEKEPGLDEILRERFEVEIDVGKGGASELDDQMEDLEEEEPLKLVPKQADEFVCRSCFLVKKLSQMADKKRRICLDCV